MKTKTTIFISLIALFILVACQPAAEYDIRGTWEYVMTDTNGNTYDEDSNPDLRDIAAVNRQEMEDWVLSQVEK